MPRPPIYLKGCGFWDLCSRSRKKQALPMMLERFTPGATKTCHVSIRLVFRSLVLLRNFLAVSNNRLGEFGGPGGERRYITHTSIVFPAPAIGKAQLYPILVVGGKFTNAINPKLRRVYGKPAS